MPIYEYRCKNCSHQFEIQQSMSDDALTDCPNCNEPQLRKVFQPVGISFKGSGFYKNDSRSSSKSSSSGGSSSSSSSSTSSSSSSSSSSSDSSSTSSAPSESTSSSSTASASSSD
ncbi:MAG: FmdB family transcriptional regulator [Microthrixaceae bacterium]|nr:FmdB family transcriptional regulator [Microthrixaceae bacterium]